jgi:cyclopropane fatty-acyl-phospholipid synthase-like methyltransferase
MADNTVRTLETVQTLESEIENSKALRPGGSHYRAYVGPPEQYDFMGATQFALLFRLGIREEHFLLDIGCGSLRSGRFVIQYLLPNRYFGFEPNEWLWQNAEEKELGSDLFRIKVPFFSSNDSFSFEEANQKFDFILAQSIFSHTGLDVLGTALDNARKVLTPTGQFLFTILDEATPQFDYIEDAKDKSGWIYPECVSIAQEELESTCAAIGLSVQPLTWFHPRQRWYRAVLSSDLLLDDAQLADLGTGRPLVNYDPQI